MATPTTGACEKCCQPRPLFGFSYVPNGWFEFVEVQLCARCHSNATEADENDQLFYGEFASQAA